MLGVINKQISLLSRHSHSHEGTGGEEKSKQAIHRSYSLLESNKCYGRKEEEEGSEVTGGQGHVAYTIGWPGWAPWRRRRVPQEPRGVVPHSPDGKTEAEKH